MMNTPILLLFVLIVSTHALDPVGLAPSQDVCYSNTSLEILVWLPCWSANASLDFPVFKTGCGPAAPNEVADNTGGLYVSRYDFRWGTEAPVGKHSDVKHVKVGDIVMALVAWVESHSLIVGMTIGCGISLLIWAVFRPVARVPEDPLEVEAAAVGIHLDEKSHVLVVDEVHEREFMDHREDDLQTLESLLEEGPPRPPRPGDVRPTFTPGRYARAVAAEARAMLCFGFATQINNATHRLAQQKCWQILSESVAHHNLRKAHALAILPEATALALLPSRRELEARALLATGGAAAAKRLSTAALYHEYGGELHLGMGESSQDF